MSTDYRYRTPWEFTHKRCIRCGEMRSVDEYNAKPATRDGLHPYCRQCSSKLSAQSGKVRAETVRRLRALHPDEWNQIYKTVTDELDEKEDRR